MSLPCSGSSIAHKSQNPKAIGQCRGFLTEHFPSATIERVASTAGAARALMEDDPEDLHSVAICSAVCADILTDLEVMHKSIQDKQGLSRAKLTKPR